MSLTVNFVEHIGKYYCTFVNKNYTVLKEFYDAREEYYLQNNITFPVYCYLEFYSKKDQALDQTPETLLLVGRTPIEELITQYPIK